MYLEKYLNDIRILCVNNKVKELYVFGSIITGGFTENSDIDLIVNFNSIDPVEYAINYFDLKFALEDLLNRQIDLLEDKAIINPFLRENIDNSKALLYAS